MRTSSNSLNPFSLMMEPEVVLQQMERSQTLKSLRRHKLRPLDRPLIPLKAKSPEELAAAGKHFRDELDD